MKKLVFNIFCAMLIFITSFIPLASRVYAELNAENEYDQDNLCSSVDLIILIDQSGSMEISDKGEYRSDAAKSILSRMALNPLLECPEAYHRVAVVNIGDSATDVQFSEEPSAPWLKLGGYGYDQDPAALIDEEISPYLSKIIAPHDNEYTNTQAGLERARDIMTLMRQEQLGSIQRKQAIILITDGAPATGNPDMNVYFPPIDALLDSMTDTYFWLVALSHPALDYLSVTLKRDICEDLSPDEDCTIREFWEEQAQSHGGELIQLEKNLNEIPDQLNRIYDILLGGNGIEIVCGQYFYIDPYIQNATFTFSKTNPNIQVQLEYHSQTPETSLIFRGGQKLDIDENSVSTDVSPTVLYWGNISGVESYVLSNPPAGMWRVTTLASADCPRVKVRYSHMPVVATLLSPAIPLAVYEEYPYYDSTALYFFEIRVQDSAGAPVENNPLYPLMVTLTYTDSHGNLIRPHNSDSDEWVLEYQGEGIWESRDPILVPSIDRYSISIRGTTSSADPTKPILILFERSDLSINVLDMRSFKFEIISPEKDDTPTNLPLNMVDNSLHEINTPIYVQVAVTSRGEAQDGDEVFIDKDVFSASLLTPDGIIIGEPVILTQGEDGIYSGVLRQSMDAIDPEGEYLIRVELISDWKGEWQPVNISDQVVINRYKVNIIRAALENQLIRISAQTIAGIIGAIILIYFLRILTGPLSGKVTIYKKQGIGWDDLGTIYLRSSINRRKAEKSLKKMHHLLGKLTAIPAMDIDIDESSTRPRRVFSGIHATVSDAHNELLTAIQLGDNEADEFEIKRSDDRVEEFKIEYNK